MCCICRLTITFVLAHSLSTDFANPALLRVLFFAHFFASESRRRRDNLLVRTNRMIQYMTKTGQNTGTSKMVNHVVRKAMKTALVAEYQNLNSGNLLTNGRNSCDSFVGKLLPPPAEPSSIPSSCSREGSNFGERKARKRLRR